MRGVIKNVALDRGFGFITGETGTEYFFHKSGLEKGVRFDRLEKGQHVEFEESETDKGPRAEQITLD